MIKIVRVEGQSMSPDFSDGDYLFLLKPFLRKVMLRRSCHVVFHHPVYGNLFKKVVEYIPEKDVFFAAGQNSSSLSTEKMGEIPSKRVLGFLLFHVKSKVH